MRKADNTAGGQHRGNRCSVIGITDIANQHVADNTAGIVSNAMYRCAVRALTDCKCSVIFPIGGRADHTADPLAGASDISVIYAICNADKSVKNTAEYTAGILCSMDFALVGAVVDLYVGCSVADSFEIMPATPPQNSPTEVILP